MGDSLWCYCAGHHLVPVHGSMRHSPCGRKIKRKVVRGETYSKMQTPEFREMQTSSSGYRRGDTSEYKSVMPDSCGEQRVCAAPEKKEYTGTLVKGIGTMHKSNAIPIIDEEQMKDLARMRR